MGQKPAETVPICIGDDQKVQDCARINHGDSRQELETYRSGMQGTKARYGA